MLCTNLFARCWHPPLIIINMKLNIVSNAWVGFIALLVATAGAATKQPNIIIILTDDHGFADVGIQNVVDDIHTPNIDRMAQEGVRFTDGYITAPQCVPSRAGIMSGQYQTQFGTDANGLGPMPLEVNTIAERLRDAGYATGMVGKWHLEPNWTDEEFLTKELEKYEGKQTRIPSRLRYKFLPINQGFTDVFDGSMNHVFNNFDYEGKDVEPKYRIMEGFRIDNQTKAGLAFIDRHQDEPFFLYLSYYGPHVPLEATPKYLARFPGEMPERRRYALAMMSAIDDGVGAVMDRLDQYQIDENTLIFFLSDNGAPLKIHKKDAKPITTPGWDGSLNDPWIGEKGSLMEGGIRVPFIARWKGTIPAGQEISDPIISLDMAATASAISGGDATGLEGVDLMPRLAGKAELLPQRDLFWRFWRQGALRRGSWKYLYLSDGREWLFDLSTPEHEGVNLIQQHPEKAFEMRKAFETWAAKQHRPGLSVDQPASVENVRFDHYLPKGIK